MEVLPDLFQPAVSGHFGSDISGLIDDLFTEELATRALILPLNPHSLAGGPSNALATYSLLNERNCQGGT